MNQACPGRCDFLVFRAGIAAGVDSGDVQDPYPAACRRVWWHQDTWQGGNYNSLNFLASLSLKGFHLQEM